MQQLILNVNHLARAGRFPAPVVVA